MRRCKIEKLLDFNHNSFRDFGILSSILEILSLICWRCSKYKNQEFRIPIIYGFFFFGLLFMAFLIDVKCMTFKKTPYYQTAIYKSCNPKFVFQYIFSHFIPLKHIIAATSPFTSKSQRWPLILLPSTSPASPRIERSHSNLMFT